MLSQPCLPSVFATCCAKATLLSHPASLQEIQGQVHQHCSGGSCSLGRKGASHEAAHVTAPALTPKDGAHGLLHSVLQVS